MEKIIVTIGRQFGSGGAEVGRKVAQKLGISYYDRNLLDKVSESSGIAKQFFEKADEKSPNVFLNTLAMSQYRSASVLTINEVITDDKLFMLQYEEIRAIARRESCVIVGRCADNILRKAANSLHVFICADEQDRAERIGKLYSLCEKDALALIKKTDKHRAAYYNFYTNEKWGMAGNHDICLNTSFFGIGNTVDIISDIAARYNEARK